MAKTNDFTNFANERPNYFAGQYLLEDDFEIQHKYLSDRQNYYHQSLHISGIIEGLEVEVIQEQKSVQIKSGSAIDSNGNLIVSKGNITFSDFKNIAVGELYIQYAQTKQNQQQQDVVDSYTRWIEKPIIAFATQTPANGVKLAKLTIQDTITLDVNVRKYSGLSLPNPNNQDLTLRSGGNANPNLAVLTGSLKIDGNLEVNTNLFIKGDNSSLLQIGDVFFEANQGGNREWMQRGIKIFGTSDNLFIGLKDEGNNRKDAVIAWGDDPEDDLRFINVQSGGGVQGNEAVRIKANGNVGIGTNNPGDYKLNVQGNQYNNGNLTVNGNVTGKNLSLAADNTKRGTLFLGAAGDNNHALYNNLSNIDNEGVWDGVKWNVFNGLNIRVGSGNSKTTAFYINNLGNIGIGINEPGNYKLNVQGNQYIKGNLTIQEGKVSLNGNQQIVFADTDTTNNLKLQLWTGYGLGINGSTLFYTADGNHSWRDRQNNERMLLTTGANGGLTVKGTGSSSFAGNLTITGSLSVGVSIGSTTNIDLSGHLQLKEYGESNFAYFQARDDLSNRDIGFKIRTQIKGTTEKTLVEAVTITPSGEIQGKIWYSDEYVWRNGQSHIKMRHSSKCVAFLTYVQGKFAGGGEQVYTYVAGDGYWYLGGNQGGAGADIIAKARCIGSPN